MPSLAFIIYFYISVAWRGVVARYLMRFGHSLVIVAAALAVSIGGAGGIAQGASSHEPARTSIDGAAIRSVAAGTASCPAHEACAQGIDPTLKVVFVSSGDQTGCTYTLKFKWDDKSPVQTVTVSDPPDGKWLAAKHTYAARGTYTINVTGSESGPCTLTTGDIQFKLLSYVALGDSYSSGNGAGDYLPGDCIRSRNAYPELIEREFFGDPKDTTLIFGACSGASTANFDSSQSGSIPAQKVYLEEPESKPGSVGLVTFTFGGDNDHVFFNVLRYCAARTVFEETCEEHSKGAVADALSRIEADLKTLYEKVKNAKVNGEPALTAGAKVIALGYPRIFPIDRTKECKTGYNRHDFQPSDMTWLNGVVKNFDTKTENAARAAGISYINDINAFSGHELCQRDPYVNAFEYTSPHDSFHPTGAGHAALADLIEKDLGSLKA